VKRTEPKFLVLCAFLAVASLAAALLLVRDPGHGASLEPSSAPAAPDFAREAKLPAVESSGAARASVDPAAQEAPESSEEVSPAVQAHEAADEIVARGIVVDLDDTPLPDVQVVWRDGARRDPGSPDDAKPSLGVTDGSGRFELRLDPERWRWGDLGSVLVSGPAARIRFTGAVRLERSLRIVARSTLRLRGTIECNRDLSDREVHVAAEVPASGATTVAIHGGAAQAIDGRFEISAGVDFVPSEFLVSISVLHAGVSRQAIPTRELVSDAGATIRVELSDLEIVVTDEDGAPIAEAGVHVAPASDPGAKEIRAATDGEGRARLLPPPGPLEVCLGKPGFAAHVETFDPATLGGATRTFRLRRLVPADVVEGRVVFENGSGAANVFVSANPATANPELVHPGFSSATSGEDGRFSIPIGRDLDLEVRGYHRQFGMTQEQVCAPGVRAVTLLLRRQGHVRIRLDCDALVGPPRSGAIQYVLVDRDYRSTLSGHDWSAPVEIDEVPEGDYNAFVFAPGLDGLGQGAFRLEPGEDADVLVSLEPARWISGRLVSSEGSPLEGLILIARPPTWPVEACEVLARGATDRDGRFRLLGGLGDEVRVELAGGRPFASWAMRSGEDREWRLP
jgi:hypothetical protein